MLKEPYELLWSTKNQQLFFIEFELNKHKMNKFSHESWIILIPNPNPIQKNWELTFWIPSGISNVMSTLLKFSYPSHDCSSFRIKIFPSQIGYLTTWWLLNDEIWLNQDSRIKKKCFCAWVLEPFLIWNTLSFMLEWF